MKRFLKTLFKIMGVVILVGYLIPERKAMPCCTPFFMEKCLNFQLHLSVKGDVQMLVGKLGDAPSPGRPGQEAQLHQIGLVYIL